MVFHLEEDMTPEKSDCSLTSTVKNLLEPSTPCQLFMAYGRIG